MGEPYKNSDKFIKEWVHEAGLEKPGVTFNMKVLERIESKASFQNATPLISKKGWFVLSMLFVVSIALLYFYPSELFSFTGNKISDIVDKIENLKKVSISKTTQYAFMFLALFLVQIPFLKHYLDKQRA